MRKLFVGNLPAETTEADVVALFSTYGRVRSVKLATDVFSGRCRGFGFIEMEGHEARAAMSALNGRDFHGRPLKVHEEQPGRGKPRGRR
ncbi:MAG TPA: RNA-binding protein [Candidatus Competibacteraceae bacterium]|nr:RNA-binding protein [Candidatus Competibacteraceae bacterium]